jgi:hypothetical protein
MSKHKTPYLPHDWTRIALEGALLFALLIMVGLNARTAALPRVEPTTDKSLVSTEAVATFVVGLTGTAERSPGSTATKAMPSMTPTASAGTDSATPTCLGLRYERDVTIPDNTEMTPAQVFTKTWLVQNSGVCPWQPGFKVVLVGGVAMGGSPFKVAQAVGPGGSIQISIKMVAPTTQTGIVQGTWKMSDEKGFLFGDYLSVVLVVHNGKETAGPSLATATP